MLSDLGAGVEPELRLAIQQRWVTFAGMLATAGSQVAALAPVPTHRLPADLRAAVPVLYLGPQHQGRRRRSRRPQPDA